MLASSFSNVLLPEPLRPTMPKNSPWRISNEIPSSARSSRWPRAANGWTTRSLSESTRLVGIRNDLWRSWTSIAAAVISSAAIRRQRNASGTAPCQAFAVMSALRSLAVVIPSWNSLRLLPRCLDSLRDQGELELLVVDNGSTDGTVEYLRKEEVEHVSLPRNTGFAVAVNLGAARVSAPAILVLNADTVLEPGCAATLLRALAEDDSLGGVQPRILQLEEGGEGMPAISSARLYSAG